MHATANKKTPAQTFQRVNVVVCRVYWLKDKKKEHVNSERQVHRPRLTTAPASPRLPTAHPANRKAVGLSGSRDSRGCRRRCSRLGFLPRCQRRCRCRWFCSVAVGKNGRIRTPPSCEYRSQSRSLRRRNRNWSFGTVAVAGTGRPWRFRGLCVCSRLCWKSYLQSRWLRVLAAVVDVSPSIVVSYGRSDRSPAAISGTDCTLPAAALPAVCCPSAETSDAPVVFVLVGASSALSQDTST